jgi:nucleotide-binding universal stress UspA family protein
MSTFMDREADGRSVILVGIDFSETSMGALRAAESIARFSPNSELHLVHAFGWPTVSLGSREVVASSQLGMTEDLDKAREELDKLVGPATRGVSRVTGHIRVGAPAKAIVQLASDVSADLVVVGTHGRTGFDRLMFGSVAEKVMRGAPCPVLTVRPKTVPIWEQIEPPCPECLKVQQATAGERLWCEHHSQHHARAHTYREIPPSFGMGTQTFRE